MVADALFDCFAQLCLANVLQVKVVRVIDEFSAVVLLGVFDAVEKVLLQAVHIDMDRLSTERYSQMAASLRGSVMLAGAMLGRFHRAFVPTPGGDKIGRRRLDTHFSGFEKLGATSFIKSSFKTN